MHSGIFVSILERGMLTTKLRIANNPHFDFSLSDGRRAEESNATTEQSKTEQATQRFCP